MFTISSFPELKSDRLLLRSIETYDAATILHLRSSPEITKYIERPVERQTRSMSDAETFIQSILQAFEDRKTISWAICDRHTELMMGSICLWNFSDDGKKSEVGYDLKKEFQGQGFMNEAMELVLKFGFTKIEVSVIEAYTHKLNQPSIQLLLKNGFQQEFDRTDPGNLNNAIFTIGSNDYLKAN